MARRLALALPAVVVWLSIRAAIPAHNDDAGYAASLPANVRAADDAVGAYDYVARARAISSNRLRDFNLSSLHACSTEAYGIAPCVLALFALRRNLALLARGLPFLLMIYAQLLFATDTQRLVVLAFPLILLMACSGFEAIAKRLRTSTALWLPLAVILFVALLWKPQRMTIGVLPQLLILTGYAASVAALTRMKPRPRR